MSDQFKDGRVTEEEMGSSENFIREGAELANKNFANKKDGTRLLSDKAETGLGGAILDEENSKAELEVQAVRDPLTGLYNRRYLSQEIEKLDPSSEFSLIMIDIDHFKDFNDKYGHLIGDKVLQRVARVLSEHVRSDDILVRYGGEEMVFLIKNTSRLNERAEELRKAVANSHTTHHERSAEDESNHLSVEISVGVALHSKESKLNPEETLIQADSALSESKRAGRNRITVKSF